MKSFCHFLSWLPCPKLGCICPSWLVKQVPVDKRLTDICNPILTVGNKYLTVMSAGIMMTAIFWMTDIMLVFWKMAGSTDCHQQVTGKPAWSHNRCSRFLIKVYNMYILFTILTIIK